MQTLGHAKLETSQGYICMVKGLERSAANFVNVELPKPEQGFEPLPEEAWE